MKGQAVNYRTPANIRGTRPRRKPTLTPKQAKLLALYVSRGSKPTLVDAQELYPKKNAALEAMQSLVAKGFISWDGKVLKNPDGTPFTNV